MAKRRKRDKLSNKEIEELIRSMRICAQCATCDNCMVLPVRDRYAEEFGKDHYNCVGALLDMAQGILCDYLDEREERESGGGK